MILQVNEYQYINTRFITVVKKHSSGWEARCDGQSYCFDSKYVDALIEFLNGKYKR